jgi:hypothetical protein
MKIRGERERGTGARLEVQQELEGMSLALYDQEEA